jgi:NitT/TauT family transport system ATP-binding protein
MKVKGNDMIRVQANAITFNYGAMKIINGINLAAKNNEIIVLIGPSGCGKSTLLNLLSGYLKPTSGTVSVNGGIRTIFQENGLFPWLTVEENILMGLQHHTDKGVQQQELKELVKLIHLENFEQHFPYELSGGMKQRVQLARALGGESDVLLMDEPFSSLDYQTRLRLRKELLDTLQTRPKTVVMVTHDIDEAVQLADRILVLSKRPTQVCHELNISLPHPRSMAHPEMINAVNEVMEKLGLEGMPGPAGQKIIKQITKVESV